MSMQNLASRLRLARAVSGLCLMGAVERLESLHGDGQPVAPISHRRAIAWEDGRIIPGSEVLTRLAAIYGCCATWLRSGALDGEWDGCEVILDTRPAAAVNAATLHRVTHAARWLVGDEGRRACDECAETPEMKRMKPRKRIKRDA